MSLQLGPHSTASIQVAGRLSNEVQIQFGIPQGSILYIMQNLLSHFKIDHLVQNLFLYVNKTINNFQEIT